MKASEALDMPDIFGEITTRPQPQLAYWFAFFYILGKCIG
jgi:hypothetical protein